MTLLEQMAFSYFIWAHVIGEIFGLTIGSWMFYWTTSVFSREVVR